MDKTKNNVDLHNYIYGKLCNGGIYTTNEVVEDIETIINDYGIGLNIVYSTIQKACLVYKNNNDFDYYTYITYTLIRKGKDKSI